MAKEDRGFASMDRSKQREIASKGGKTGSGHKWNSEEARDAGRKGGAVSHRNRRRPVPVDQTQAVQATGS